MRRSVPPICQLLPRPSWPPPALSVCCKPFISADRAPIQQRVQLVFYILLLLLLVVAIVVTIVPCSFH